ncbi:MAG: EamA family transporter, partial [Prevotella sp.]|nr:EamA family transporter [Prevotella sp.]
MFANRAIYHLAAFVTVAIWGSTFVFTKMLLDEGLSPAQIFTLRFAIAYIILLAYSLRHKPESRTS